MRFFNFSKMCLNKVSNTLLFNGLYRQNFVLSRVPTQFYFSTVTTESTSTNDFQKIYESNYNEQQNKKVLNYKSEATCTRRVYGENDKVFLGPPTYTIFSPEVCLTVKVKRDELTGDNSLLLTGMTRLKDGSNGFNKNSRISSLLPLDTLNELNQALKTKSENPVNFEGLDGGSVVVTNTTDSFSIKLYPSLLPGLNLSPGMLPNLTTKGKSCIDFVGNSNEHALLVHALTEISQSV